MTKAAFDKSAGGERKGASMCLSIGLMFYHLEIFFYSLLYYVVSLSFWCTFIISTRIIIS